jgi:hypothetical protein
VLKLGAAYWPPQLPSCYMNSVDFLSDGRQFVTGRGYLAVSGERDDSSATEANALANCYILGKWITYASFDVLRLPPDCRYP